MSYVLAHNAGLGGGGGGGSGGSGGSGGNGGNGGSGGNVGGTVSSAIGAAASVTVGAVNLYYSIMGGRQRAEDVAGQREGLWSSEIGGRNQSLIQQQQDAEVRAAQNAVLSEQDRSISEQERAIGLEAQNIVAQAARDRARAEAASRQAEALRFRMPAWGWYSLAGVGVAAVIGIAAYVGSRP